MLKETNILETEDSNYDTSLIPWEYLKKNHAKIVEYHLAIINIAEKLESIFSWVLLAVFINTLAVESLLIYRLSLVR
ncbi:hypothetical protein ILUMI_15187 [Ignelater luminosus]|uniref:Uncharacterized protein n=1 Tax=Ignelater luminosus TaxID=2038154 RepID=A0A8K0G9S3_IGNLU|nr:hypothetical protein ILUMI_15187 [Ignelater luminosus]